MTTHHEGWVEGGTNDGDFHVWIEDSQGTVVFDPHFIIYDDICDLRGLDITKPVYKEWNNRNKWLMDKDVLDLFHPSVKSIVCDMFDRPQARRCRNNSVAWLCNHGDIKEHRLVIGSMGWEYKNKSGAFYEFG